MSESVIIKTGELFAGRDGFVIQTGSVGSCVVIALYDDKAKVGGMAHAMLPTRRLGGSDDLASPAKYSDEAVDKLILEIEKLGGNKANLVAKLVGGGSMFKSSTSHIGDENVISVRKRLTDLGIHIENEDTGGSMGKSVEMNLLTGLIKVETSL